MSDTPKKPTIDERLEALTMNLELLSHRMEESHARMLEMDARERKGRTALLTGIIAYLRALNNGDSDKEGTAQ